MKSNTSTSLKDQYRARLLAVLAANVVVLFAAITFDAIRLEGIRAAATDLSMVLQAIGAIGFGFAITTILNGLLSANWKARLVFCRWQHPLPGCRAFSHYLTKDPRIDFAALRREFGKLPRTPDAQNVLWYRIHKTVENEPMVLHVHREFLFSRDYAGLAALSLVVLGIAGAIAIPSTTTKLVYGGMLVVQLAVTICAARNYGARLVTTSVAAWQKGVPRA